MVSTDLLKRKAKISALIDSDVERFLAGGGSINHVNELAKQESSRSRIKEARNWQQARAKEKYRRLEMISAAHKKLNND